MKREELTEKILDIKRERGWTWKYITEEIGTGVLAPDKKRGDLWFEIGATETFNQWMWVSSGGDADNWEAVQGQTFVNDAVTLNWQVTDTTWRRMTIIGLHHNNLIYGGKSVNIASVYERGSSVSAP